MSIKLNTVAIFISVSEQNLLFCTPPSLLPLGQTMVQDPRRGRTLFNFIRVVYTKSIAKILMGFHS